MLGRIVAAASSCGTLLPELTETDSLNPGGRVNGGSRSGSSGYCPPPLTFDGPTVAAAANGLPSALYLAAAITMRNRQRPERKINASIRIAFSLGRGTTQEKNLARVLSQ